MASTGQRVLAFCALGAVASLGIGVLLQAPAPVRGLRGRPDGLQIRATKDVPLPSLQSPLREIPQVASADARAWLKRSVELAAQGRYDEARASCRALMASASPALITACVAPIDGFTGRYDVARHNLEDALKVTGSNEQEAWLYSLLGELAFWNGDLERAEQALGSALALTPTDPQLLQLHVDLLLDTGRARHALSMLAGQDADDGMLLRETLAYQQLGLTQAARSSAQRFQQRIEQARARGEGVPARAEARFYANLPGHEKRALALARAAFAVQQEPWDARILLEASVHAGDPESAQPALNWLARTHLESPALHLLAAQVASPR